MMFRTDRVKLTDLIRIVADKFDDDIEHTMIENREYVAAAYQILCDALGIPSQDLDEYSVMVTLVALGKRLEND